MSIARRSEPSHYQGQVNYQAGICPVVENLNDRLLTHEFMRPPMTEQDLDDVIAAFEKVFDNLAALRSFHERGGDRQ